MGRLGLAAYTPGKQYEQELHTLPAHLADHFGLEGPNYGCLTACAAGTQAIGEALELIRRGDADLMLAGGAHSMIHPLGVTGFSLLTALSTRNDAPTKASRPFDRHARRLRHRRGGGRASSSRNWNTPRRAARRSTPS